MDKPNPDRGIAKLTEKSMTPEWRTLRDGTREMIGDTITAVEKFQANGGDVQEGFGLLVTDMGPSGRNRAIAEQPNVPGLYVGVREGNIQEVSRVVDTGFGISVYFLRMPNFEPGHSPEVGEFAVQGGVEYEAGSVMFPNDGSGATTASVQIGADGMVTQYRWTGDQSMSHGVYRAEQMQQSQQWVDFVAQKMLPTH